MKTYLKAGVLTVFGAVVATAGAGVLDRPEGIKIGKRMTLRPYVSMSLSYDSNVRGTHDSSGDGLWTVSPGLGLSYDAENWALLLSGYYNYRQYFKSENSDLGNHSFGEDLRWNWSNSKGAEKGWSLVLAESFQQVNMADDMTLTDGRGYTADSRQFQVSAALQRRFNEHWHADVNGSYYWLDYMNDTSQSMAMYGWSRWLAGGEIGFAPSKWTDILVAGNYQGYSQDNSFQYVGGNSNGFSLQGGIGSYMTERISYRLLAGWSRFDYGGDASVQNGFVYTASGNWKIGETWNTMLLATSYYQPSERQAMSASRVDAVSWGLAKSMIRGKLRGTLDFRYHRDTNVFAGDSVYNVDYTVDIITARLGFDYNLNRLLALFVYGEYQRSWNSEGDSRYYAYDYDRWRVTAGFRIKY